MIKSFKLLFIIRLCLIISLSSCLKQSESIEPFAETISLSESQTIMFNRVVRESMGAEVVFDQPDYYYYQNDPDHFYLKVNYSFKDLNLDDLDDSMNSNEIMDILGNSFVQFFAKIFFKMGGTYDVDLGAIDLDIPFVNIDYDVVKEISVTEVYFEYSQDVQFEYGNEANFFWINELSIYHPWTIPGASQPMDVLLFDYTDDTNYCFYRCVDMKIYTFDIIPFIDNKTSLKLNPELTIQDLPPMELEFTGHVEFLIKLKLPF